jgi:hypothetical protein
MERRTSPAWLSTVAKLVIVLNLLDALFTIPAVASGEAVEANPLMAVLLARGPLLFMLGKLALVSLCVLLLWRMRSNRLAVAGLVGAVPVYSLIVVYHVSINVLLARLPT